MSSGAFSSPISVNPARMRATAEVHDAAAADFEAYRSACQEWIAGVEADILHCQGAVAAPVGEVLAGFATAVSGQVRTASAHHGAMHEKLVAAAAGYERTDEAGAAGITAVGV